ncbi:MAG: retroviral-like aspartic protease family protein [Spirulinaceae cyanobacterium]
MSANHFFYKVVRGTYQPIVTIGVKFPVGWYPLETYVDSGAEYTVIEAAIADSVGFDYRQGRRIYLRVGNGSLIPIYLNTLDIQLGSVQFPCHVGFSEQLNVNVSVLGKADVFDRFRVCFAQS